jgi:hypothetical protein
MWARLVGTSLSVLLLASAAFAGPPSLVKGAVVYDPTGAVVGTVDAIKGDAAVVNTSQARVTLGLTSFQTRNGRLTIAMTRQALEQAAGKVQSQGDSEVRALLKPGASVFGDDGEIAAVVTLVDADRVTLEVGKANAVVPIASIKKGPKGPRINGTAADFRTRIAAQTPETAATQK